MVQNGRLISHASYHTGLEMPLRLILHPSIVALYLGMTAVAVKATWIKLLCMAYPTYSVYAHLTQHSKIQQIIRGETSQSSYENS
eukprot:COSAG05_NODE_2523_length_2946_cov_5.044335_5_plen_85_part_00